jgi:Ca2+-binding RTX toxin-like protein
LELEEAEMSRITFSQWVTKLIRPRRTAQTTRNRRQTPTFEQLDERITPSVNAFAVGGVLTVVGDNLDNTIEVSRNADGQLLVNGGDVKIGGNSATAANTKAIKIFGLGGNDHLSFNETNGALPQANLFGGSGDDTLIGGAAADFLFGQAGNDTLMGNGGLDSLFGGAGNDVLTGGAGNDEVFGQAGNDRMIWNPGDASDRNEGGSGSDTVEVNGGNVAEAFLGIAVKDRILFERIDPAPFTIDIGTSENLVVSANGGDDSFSADGNLPGLIVDGGAGNDTIVGGTGNDVLRGGDGIDFIDGNQGSDVASLGAGDDVFRWDPGDGSDTVEGGTGYDTMLFNGANVNEKFDVSANGERAQFVRDVGNVTMDLNDIDRIDLNTLGGADSITVNDLSGTDVAAVNLNLAGGGGKSVVINGTADTDAVAISGDANGLAVIGLASEVNITGANAAADRLTVNALAGDDVVDATGLVAEVIQLTANGGDGDDELLGSDGADRLVGDDGDDVLIGGPGADTLDGGAGDNLLKQD